jgi:hypothetical protein
MRCFSYVNSCPNVTQDVFLIPDGAPGALAELERRKFTAEEGVSVTTYKGININMIG